MVEVRAYEIADVAAMVDVWNEIVRDGIAGVDIATVAIWLGHENINTTHKYVVTNMKAKEEALEKVRVEWGDAGHTRYKATQSVLDFLNSL